MIEFWFHKEKVHPDLYSNTVNTLGHGNIEKGHFAIYFVQWLGCFVSNACILIKILLTFVLKGPIDNTFPLIQVIDHVYWQRRQWQWLSDDNCLNITDYTIHLLQLQYIYCIKCLLWCTVYSRYSAAIFLQTTHERHPLTCPLGRDKGCLREFNVWPNVSPLQLLWCAQYNAIYDRDICAYTCYAYVYIVCNRSWI